MKRWQALALALTMLCSLSAAWAEESGLTLMVGRIALTVPGVPALVQEKDITLEEAAAHGEGYPAWTDKWQLVGQTGDEAEYAIHVLNAGPMLEKYRTRYPEEGEQKRQLRVLNGLVQYFLLGLNAEMTQDPAIGLTGSADAPLPVIIFSYRYPPSWVKLYYGKAMMDGEQAVVLLCKQSKESQKVLQAMRAVSRQEAAAYAAQEPETARLNEMEITFPIPASNLSMVGHQLRQALCPDGTYTEADYVEMPLWMFGEVEDLDAMLSDYALSTAESYQKRGIISEFTLLQPAPGVYGFTARCPAKGVVNGTPKTRDRMAWFMTAQGIYTVTATDTPAGRAMLDSIRIIPNGEEE